MSVRLSDIAHERLEDIYHYTLERFGEEKAEEYIGAILDAAERFDQGTNVFPTRPYPNRSGVTFFRCQHHFVFCRRLSDGNLGVMTILHERMDIPARLADDTSERL